MDLVDNVIYIIEKIVGKYSFHVVDKLIRNITKYSWIEIILSKLFVDSNDNSSELYHLLLKQIDDIHYHAKKTIQTKHYLCNIPAGGSICYIDKMRPTDSPVIIEHIKYTECMVCWEKKSEMCVLNPCGHSRICTNCLENPRQFWTFLL